MIKKVKSGLKKRKVKLFFIFLLCSFLAWLVSNLSETYTSNANFNLNFIGIPEDRLLMGASKEMLEVRLEAVGFQFLRFNFRNKEVDIDLSQVSEMGGRYFVTKNQYQKQIERQLSNSMRLDRIVEDTLFFEFDQLMTKEVPVVPDINIGLSQNHVLDGPVTTDPTKITIIGPAGEVRGIGSLKTLEIELNEVSADFSRTAAIVKPDSLVHTTFSHEQVTMRGVVSRFSEKIIEVPVQVVNLPDTMAIQTFPEQVEILCKAKMSDLKQLGLMDFQVVADYDQVTGENQKNRVLSLELRKKPERVFTAALVQNRVQYILKTK